MGGAVGNLIDRLTADPGFGVGHVTDFIAYGTWFVGNVADIWIVLGAALLAVALGREPERRKASELAYAPRARRSGGRTGGCRTGPYARPVALALRGAGGGRDTSSLTA